MGIVHSFDQLDPVAYARARAFVGERETIALDEVRALLAEYGRDRPQQFHNNEDWAAVEELLEGDAATRRWLVVRACSSRKSWCIDKALDRPAGGFQELFAREPSLALVARLFASDEKPLECRGAEELMQIVAASAVVTIRDAMRPWLDDDVRGRVGARARIAELKPSLVTRLLGPHDFAAQWRDPDAYLWQNWKQLGDAVMTCADAREPMAVTWG